MKTCTKKPNLSHNQATATCAGLDLKVVVFVVTVRVEPVAAEDVKIVQEVEAVAAPTKSRGLERGALAGICKVACCLEAWEGEWAWAWAWDVVWDTEMNLKCQHQI